MSETPLPLAIELGRRAEMLRRVRRFREAEHLFDLALAGYKHACEPGDVRWAICQDNLATLYQETGRCEFGIPLHQAALEVFRSHRDQPLHIAIGATNLGTAYLRMGNVRAAERYLREAEARHADIGPSGNYVGTLVDLANVRTRQGDTEAGEQLLRRAATMRDGLDSCAPYISLALDSSLGSMLTTQGRLEEAEPLLEATAKRAARTIGPMSGEALRARTNLADLYRRRGALEQAQQELESLLDALVGIGDVESEPLTSVRANLALLHEARQMPEKALPLVVANADMELLRAARALRLGAETDRISTMMANVHEFSALLGFARRWRDRVPAAISLALESWLRRKALVTELMAAERGRKVEQEPAVADARSRLATIREQLADDIRLTSSRFVRSMHEWEFRRRRLRALRLEAEDLERSVAPRLPDVRAGALLEDISVERLATCLPPTAAIIEFTALDVREGATEPANARVRPSASAERGYLAFVIRPGDEPSVKLVELASASEMHPLIGEFRAAIGGRAGRDARPPAESEVPSDELDAGLRERLIEAFTARLQPELRGVDHLVLCPDGALWSLPFQALPLDGERYWIDEYEIAYRSAARDLLEAVRRVPEPAREPPLVLAAPAFSLSRSAPVRYPPLDGARAEGIGVAALFGVAPRLGKEATTGVLLAAHGPALLHIATHGFFDSPESHYILHETGSLADVLDDPAYRRLNAVVETQSRAHSGPVHVRRITDEPGPEGESASQLLASGLALAGANDAWAARQSSASPSPPGDPGELLAVDVVRMDLVGTTIAVLSACDTGLGQVLMGEGTWGLPLAFTVAGAASVVMSLWKVDDRATRDLMTDFYGRLARGDGKAAALRASALRLREQQPHPRIWAPFICLGDDGPLPASVLAQLPEAGEA